MKITPNLLDEFRNDFEVQMKGLQAKYGVKVSLGNMSYSNTQFTSKVTVTDTAGGNADDAEGKASLKKDGWRFDLTEKDYNKKFSYNGKNWKLKGIKPRSRKYPIVAENVADGRSYKLPGHSLSK